MPKKTAAASGKRTAQSVPEQPPASDAALRDQLVKLLRGGGAHVSFEDAVAGLPPKLRAQKAAGVPFTAWGLLEHMRIAQWDILEFSRDPNHVSPKWPEDYWPRTDSPPSIAAWDKSIKAFRADLKQMQKLVSDPARNLYTPFEHGEGQTLLREALLIADHNAYHIGELVILRRLLGAWK
jgi:hypothetical protein